VIRGDTVPISLIIVDGHSLIRYGLCELVSRQADIDVTAECGSVAEAERAVQAACPDVITLDTDLPDGDGLELARRLRERHPDLGIVILTAADQDTALFRAVRCGASAFVAKAAPVAEILAAIRHAGVAAASFSASGLAAALTRRHQTSQRMALSPRETEVLQLLRDGLSVPAIAMTMYISHSTAKTYVARLYEKLGAANRAQALMTAVRYGLIGRELDVHSQVA
jgi:DNA-binding NarL/FixJ family response regulator